MARRSDLGNKEQVWSREDLKEISRKLAVLSEPGVRESYQRVYRECAIVNSTHFSPGGGRETGHGVEATEKVATAC
jgi:hypothetical protein